MENKNKATQFDQYIQYKALGFKFINESVTEVVIDEDNEEFPVKNVCAKLSCQLSDEIDNTVKILSMSKRKFIELALIEAIAKSKAIMDEVDITEYLRDGEDQ